MGAKTVLVQWKGPDDHIQQPMPVCRPFSRQIKIIGIVIAGQACPAFQVGDQRPGVRQHSMGREQRETALPDLVQQKGVDLGDQRAQPHEIRCDGIEDRQPIRIMNAVQWPVSAPSSLKNPAFRV